MDLPEPRIEYASQHLRTRFTEAEIRAFVARDAGKTTVTPAAPKVATPRANGWKKAFDFLK